MYKKTLKLQFSCKVITTPVLISHLILIFSILFSFVSTSAQQKLAPIIPSNDKKQDTFTEINRLNSYVYRDIIPQEILDLITRGKLIIKADLKTDFSWDSLGGKINSSNASVVNANGIGDFLPYGNLSEILLKGDKKKAFEEIILNVESHISRYPYFESSFQILWFESDRLKRGAKGTFSRVFPKLVDQNQKSLQLFRELFLIKEPKNISDTGWLSYRFMGEDEDLYWLLSPSGTPDQGAESTELTGSNRSDSFPTTYFAPDDLFTWSAKAESISGTIKGEKNYLVPVTQQKPIFSSSDEKCINTENSQEKTSTEKYLKNVFFSPGNGKWNFDAKQSTAAGWSPANQRFVLRPLTEIQIFSNDFFTPYGRQLLLVDSETFLPYYKIVYDRAGELAKVIFTSFQAVRSETSMQPNFVPNYTLVIDKKSESASIIEFGESKLCSNLPEGVNLGNFDIRNFATKKTEKVAPLAKKAN